MASPSSCELSNNSNLELCAPSASEESTDDYYYDDYNPEAALGLVKHRPTSGVDDYIHDILETCRRTENLRLPAADYLANKKELDQSMRFDLSELMIDLHHNLRLPPEILYQAFYIVDRYLSLQDVAAKELRPVGASALFIASKYHLRHGPEACCFAWYSTSVETAMLKSEKDVLRKLNWNLSAPTTYEFLTMFLKASADCDEEMQFAAFFFGEMGLMDYSAVARPPSLRAAAALYAARCTLQRMPLWPDELVQVTKYSELQLLEPAHILVTFHMLFSMEGNKLMAVYKKYAAADRKAVALRPPATPLIQERTVACSSVHGAPGRRS